LDITVHSSLCTQLQPHGMAEVFKPMASNGFFAKQTRH